MKLKQFAIPLAALALMLSMGKVVAEPAQSQEDLNKMAEEYNAKVDDEGKEVVCKYVSKVGSRIKEKQCRTKAQIKRDEDEAKRYAQQPKQSYKSN